MKYIMVTEYLPFEDYPFLVQEAYRIQQTNSHVFIDENDGRFALFRSKHTTGELDDNEKLFNRKVNQWT